MLARFLVLTLLVCCRYAAGLQGFDRQGLAPEFQQAPRVFKASADLVRLDVSVTDDNGMPVTGLQSKDFDILQDGKPQRVQFAEFRAVSRHARPGQPLPTTEAMDGRRDRVSLAPTEAGRRIVLIVDDLRMKFDSVARTRVEVLKFIDSGLLQEDDVAIIGTTGQGNGTALPFTRDVVQLRKQAEALRWESDRREDTRGLWEADCRSTVLSSERLESGFNSGLLGAVASALVDARKYSGRKVFLVLADGISLPCPEYSQSFGERLRRLTDLASRSSVIVYGLQTAPFSSGLRMPEHRATAADVVGVPTMARVNNTVSDSLRKLSEPTGGFARRSNDIDGLLHAALSDPPSYYLVAYEPPPGTFTDRTLRYRKVSVRIVNGTRVHVRTRSGFYSVADDALGTPF